MIGIWRFLMIDNKGLVLTLMAQALRAVDRGATGSARWIERVRDRLHDEFAERLHLDDLARGAGVHPAHLTKCFRLRFGCSVGDYVRRLRVAAALRLITETDQTLAAIAAQTGFSDQSHMGRVVRRETGRTPAVWRSDRSSGRGGF